MTKPQLYACLTYADARKGISFLETLGFETRLIVADPADEATVVHAQLHWRDNGGIMLGSVRSDDPSGCATRSGHGVCNLVVASDDEVKQLFHTALEVGATTAMEPHNPSHGGCSATVTDFEGNMWNFDSYPGE